MKEPFETCNKGYEHYVYKRFVTKEMSQEEWEKWYNEHCGICPYFSGYICAEEDLRK